MDKFELVQELVVCHQVGDDLAAAAADAAGDRCLDADSRRHLVARASSTVLDKKKKAD